MIKENIYKILTQERKEKLGINQQNSFQTSGRGSLLNLTKVHITTKGNRSMNMNMEKGGITMNNTIYLFIYLFIYSFIYLFTYLLYLTLVCKIVENNSTNKYQQKLIKIWQRPKLQYTVITDTVYNCR